jgi:hypothetical protein
MRQPGSKGAARGVKCLFLSRGLGNGQCLYNRTEVGNLWPETKSGPPFVFVNKVLLKQSCKFSYKLSITLSHSNSTGEQRQQGLPPHTH